MALCVACRRELLGATRGWVLRVRPLALGDVGDCDGGCSRQRAGLPELDMRRATTFCMAFAGGLR